MVRRWVVANFRPLPQRWPAPPWEVADSCRWTHRAVANPAPGRYSEVGAGFILRGFPGFRANTRSATPSTLASRHLWTFLVHRTDVTRVCCDGRGAMKSVAFRTGAGGVQLRERFPRILPRHPGVQTLHHKPKPKSRWSTPRSAHWRKKTSGCATPCEPQTLQPQPNTLDSAPKRYTLNTERGTLNPTCCTLNTGS